MASEELLKWLTTHRLVRHKDTLTDENNLGLASLEDLMMLSENDIGDVTTMCNMNIGERNRFRTEVMRLQQKESSLPPDVEEDAPEASPSPEADKAGASPQTASTASPRPAGSASPRTASPRSKVSPRQGGPERPRVASPRQGGPERPRVGVDHDKASPRASPRRSVPIQPVESTREPPQEPREPPRDPHEQLDQPVDDEGLFDWYEVVKSMVVVKAEPRKEAKDLGCMWKGTRMQAKKDKIYDRQGHPWVELSALQMLLSCESCDDPLAQGFALIDGSHLGLGPLLRFQRESDAAPQPKKVASQAKLASPTKSPAKDGRTARPDEGSSDDSEEEEETQHSRHPKSFRPSPFRVQGAKQQWQASLGGAGEEELRRQQAKPRGSEEAEDYQKAVRKARAERIEKAQALKALKQYEEEEEAKKRQAVPVLSASEDETDEEERNERQRKMQDQRSRDEAFDVLQRYCDEGQQNEEALRHKTIVYRAVYDLVYTMRAGDPASGSISRVPCQPGTAFYSSGEQWAGPQGGIWLRRQAVGADGREGDQGWMLLHSPETAEDEPWLLREDDIADGIRIQVRYLAESHSFRVFETFLSRSSKVRALKARLCAETGLRIGSVVLMPRLSEGCRRHSDVSENEGGLSDYATLAEAGLRGREAQLYMLYTSNFAEHFQDGRLLRKRKPRKPKK